MGAASIICIVRVDTRVGGHNGSAKVGRVDTRVGGSFSEQYSTKAGKVTVDCVDEQSQRVEIYIQ
jgi:hypothetical protein